MTIFLKQSTAVTLMIGPFIDDTDGKSAETVVAITDSNTWLSKNGGAFAVKHETTHPAHDANPGGYYTCLLDTTDTNTLGVLRLAVHIAGSLPVWQDLSIVPANVWDSLFGADLLDVSTVQWLGTACHAAGTAGVPEVAIHDQATALVDAILDEVCTAGHATAGSLGKLVGDNLNAPVATVDTVVDAILADTGTDGVVVGTLTADAITANSLSAGAVDKIHDEIVEGTLTARQILRLLLAAIGGETSGGGTVTVIFRDNADTKARITMTVDANGNRSAVVLDGA